LTNEVLFPAWSIEGRHPVFFSKSQDKVKDFGVGMDMIVLAAATSPSYFDPTEIPLKEGQ